MKSTYALTVTREKKPVMATVKRTAASGRQHEPAHQTTENKHAKTIGREDVHLADCQTERMYQHMTASRKYEATAAERTARSTSSQGETHSQLMGHEHAKPECSRHYARKNNSHQKRWQQLF